jgi:TrmH family RNA methyltransferase
MKEPRLVSSRSHELVKRLHRLASEPGAYRKLASVWLEGDHLCKAWLARGGRASLAVIGESAWTQQMDLRALALQAPEVVVLADALLGDVSSLDTPARIGFVIELPAEPAAPLASVDSVVLDRLQDPGNVGTILRSAAALGIRQVLALKGSAALWSPKVLRAGMGAHFALALHEGLAPERLDDLVRRGLALVATSSHTRDDLHRVSLPTPCAWVLGHEGQGVDAAVLARCALSVRIPQPGGEESLNVAAAAAICFYETARQRLAAGEASAAGAAGSGDSAGAAGAVDAAARS